MNYTLLRTLPSYFFASSLISYIETPPFELSKLFDICCREYFFAIEMA